MNLPARRTWLLVGLVCLAMLCLLAPGVATACPTCAAAVAEQENGQQAALGYQLSVLLLVGMPFLLFGGLGGMMYWEVRRAQYAATATVPSESSLPGERGA